MPNSRWGFTGAAYLRVSTDKQDTLRQIESIRAFERRHGVTTPPGHWFNGLPVRPRDPPF
jgi:hypothetical protein